MIDCSTFNPSENNKFTPDLQIKEPTQDGVSSNIVDIVFVIDATSSMGSYI